MSKLYGIKDEYAGAWKEKLPPEQFEAMQKDGFDIDRIVDLSAQWDMALQRILDQVKVIRDDG